MGLLDNILGGGRRGGGGPSAMTLALMALLAYRTYHGKGRLADMMGRSGPGSGAPDAGGGLGGLLGGILGGQQPGRAGASGRGFGDLLRGGGLVRLHDR